MSELPRQLELKRDRLLEILRQLDSCAVAYSGGVDSAVLAKAAHLALGEKAIAVTAKSPSLASGEIEQAREVARLIGIEHREIDTSELQNPDYQRNAPDRCYHCKSELYSRLDQLAPKLNVQEVVAGANLDDTGDYRPGLKAAAEHQVRNPLAECEITKDEVRQLAAHWNLPVWDKPATPCLSSRIAYGEEVTPERLAMIDQAEQFLRQRGFNVVRVRYHKGDLARVEVPLEELPRLLEEPFRNAFAAHLQSLGFRHITLDLQGFRSGSMNLGIAEGSLPIVG